MWAAKDNGRQINWEGTKSYCENYRGGGYTDWRMPTSDELVGLYDSTVMGKNDYHLTNLIELSSCCPWASSTQGSDAISFNFYNGLKSWNLKSFNYYYRALPVRSGK